MIIGLTGTFAGGKDTVADYLVEKKGFGAYGTGDVVREYVKKLGWPMTRDKQREMGNKLRMDHGADFIVKEAIKKAKGENKVITGIRQPNEADFLNDGKDMYLMEVSAPLEIRFKRMQSRDREGDPKTVEELKEKENKEMHGDPNDKNVQNISYCMKVAKYKIDNSGTKEELYKKVDKILEELYAKRKEKV